MCCITPVPAFDPRTKTFKKADISIWLFVCLSKSTWQWKRVCIFSVQSKVYIMYKLNKAGQLCIFCCLKCWSAPWLQLFTMQCNTVCHPDIGPFQHAKTMHGNNLCWRREHLHHISYLTFSIACIQILTRSQSQILFIAHLSCACKCTDLLS